MPNPIASQPLVSRTPIDGVADYAVHFHSALGVDHVAACPLGAYLLLAAIAPSSTGAVRAELERTLGCPANEAVEFLSALLASPHPAVTSAIAIWNDPQIASEAFDRWMQALPAGLGAGPIPAQADADAWARQATHEMIQQFPLQISPLTVLLLASALATKGPWQEPFHVVPARELGLTPWTREVRNVLIDFVPGGQVIVWTQSAGLVGALISRTTEALVLISVIAEPAVAPHAAIAAAHEIAALVSGRASTAAYRSLFDLPLGAGHAWEIRESELETAVQGERRESAQVRIPAWQAQSPEIDLMGDAKFGFRAAAAALVDLLPPIREGYQAQGAQATTAKFDRYGFSAASVTALAMLGAAMMPPPLTAKGLLRHATVRFSRPFAVVAVAQSPRELQHMRGLSIGAQSEPHPWHGVPVFTAWITRPTEPDVSEPTEFRLRRRVET